MKKKKINEKNWMNFVILLKFVKYFIIMKKQQN